MSDYSMTRNEVQRSAVATVFFGERKFRRAHNITDEMLYLIRFVFHTTDATRIFGRRSTVTQMLNKRLIEHTASGRYRLTSRGQMIRSMAAKLPNEITIIEKAEAANICPTYVPTEQADEVLRELARQKAR